MPNILDQICQLLLDKAEKDSQPTLAQITAAFKNSRTGTISTSKKSKQQNITPIRLEVHNTWGSLSRLVAAALQRNLSRSVLLLTAHVPEADEAQDDMEAFAEQPAMLFPANEATDGNDDPTSECACERLRICQMLPTATEPLLIAAPVQAIMQPVPQLDFLEDQSLVIDISRPSSRNKWSSPSAIAQWLVDHNFTRVDQVDVVGEFAVRGGIVDIYPPGQDHPVRIEFFGDEIESLRFFDLDTQRSLKSINHITVVGCNATVAGTQTATLFDYLPADTLLIIENPTEVNEVGRIFRDRLEDPDSVFTVESVLSRAQRFDVLYACRFAAGITEQSVSFQAQSVQRYENQMIAALDQLSELAKEQHVFLFCENPAEKQRVHEILTIEQPLRDNNKQRRSCVPASNASQKPLPKKLHLVVGLVHHGFVLPDSNFVLLSHHEIFGQQHRRRIRRTRNTQAIDSFTDLDTNDLVVHINHGIGQYRGIKTLTKHGRQEEYLAIEYAGKAIVHVPAANIDLVHKYVGAMSGRPKLSKLGTQTWNRQKEKAYQAVEDMATSLLEIQAHRQIMPGIAYPADTTWQQEFEDAFPYQETDDQNTTSVDIKKDMQQVRPMDRLLCGDVGYGKTELAMRAAFKAVEYGKQVAVLVPTTILAEQHYRTFSERLADFPFIIESLSRFKTAKQATNIIARAALGQVDIVIGTHRLLSKDVSFKDLGMVIIDEEQRFGVEHKERLKQMRQTVDILTMTATPIPRTLHLAMLGIRDISSLTTPPMDRRSIVTEVCAFDKKRIRNMILRELNREGQVYFVHNRVQDIESFTASIQQLVPEARIVFGHGQMPKHELEKRMLQFVRHKADILISTTIIESGLDIPNANTIIIDNADRFGLAELHQLRGRVGRHKNRAYAYMLLPQKRNVNPTAVKRLKAIEEYSQLGSGFRIAMRDLEIRGAGNILGMEQSGHIEAVGYELYCRLLAAAVRRKKGEPEPVKKLTHLEFNIHSNIPQNYIASDRQRLEIYRRLATCSSAEDLEQLETDIVDLFGKPPQSVNDLLQLAEIRLLASCWKIKSIVQKEPDLIFSLDDPRSAEQLFAKAPGSVRVPDPYTVHVRLRDNYFESTNTLFAVMRRFLQMPQ